MSALNGSQDLLAVGTLTYQHEVMLCQVRRGAHVQ